MSNSFELALKCVRNVFMHVFELSGKCSESVHFAAEDERLRANNAQLNHQVMLAADLGFKILLLLLLFCA